MAHALGENRNGLIAAAMATTADSFAEREAALTMLEAQRKGRKRRVTLGAAKAYVSKGFGWLKETGPLREVKLRGLHKIDWLFVFSCAAYNLCEPPGLIA